MKEESPGSKRGLPRPVDSGVPEMRAILFIDDWMLDGLHDVERVFPAPRPEKLTGTADFDLCTIIRDPGKGVFRAWARTWPLRERAFHFESGDGLEWLPTGHSRPSGFGQWYYDAREKDPARRHKSVACLEKKGGARNDRLMVSPDGLKWKTLPGARWLGPGAEVSDTNNNLFYNPFMGDYGIVCRKYWADRRIALVSSTDLVNWSRPRLILQPDPLDPPLAQFYGMAVNLYRDEIFLGFPQLYRAPNDESGRPDIKMSGYIHSELAYSYDGRGWNRTDRRPVIPAPGPGEFGAEGIYVNSALVRPGDGRIIVYSRGNRGLHDAVLRQRLPESSGGKWFGLLAHSWRADGFACLRAFSNRSMVRTRYLVPRSPELTLNIQLPFGEARARVVDDRDNPVPGYAFEDCLPLAGDGIRLPVRWRGKDGLSGVLGRKVRLEITFTSGGYLYALNLHCAPWYTATRGPIPRP